MVSHSELALLNSTGQPAAAKSRKSRARRAATSKKAKRTSSGKLSKPATEKQPSGANIIPVMKLRAIDIVDDSKPENYGQSGADDAREEPRQAIQMPPPANMSGAASETVEENTANGDANGASNSEAVGQKKGSFTVPADSNGEPVVTDPELLELLEQLSVTIDTANTALDAAATLPSEEEEAGLENAENSGQRPAPPPEPAPEPVPAPERETEDLPPLAARLAPETPPARQKGGIGFGLAANTALIGLILAAGIAWVLHTNPWLMEEKTVASIEQPVAPVITQDAKDQTSLQIKDSAPMLATAAPRPAQASFSPPDDDPVPMESVKPPVPRPAATSLEPASGPAGQPIALNITLPADPSGGEMSVMIQGVPDKTKLSAGKSLGAGNWLLSEPQLDGLTLTTDKGFKPGNYELEVILVRSDGKVPETRKVSLAVGPAIVGPKSLEPLAARPETKVNVKTATPVAASPKTKFVKTGVAIQVASTPAIPEPDKALSRLTKLETQTLLTRGETLLREGDVAGARLLLEYAANSGSKQAMVKLGNSYDPEHLAKLGVRGVQPDEAQAILWYDRAAKLAAAR